jgi:hypothetical protein
MNKMKKALTIISLCALSLMAAEDKEMTYTGHVLISKCQGTCTQSDYKAGDKVLAVIDGKKYSIEMTKGIPAMSEAKMEMAYGHDDVTFKGVIQGNTIIASQVERIPDMKGFLGVQSCVDKGIFTDCDLKKYSEGDKVVAFIDGKTYQLDKQTVSKTKIDHAIMNNSVGFFGQIDGDTLKLENMIYEGPEKGFFKGCV